MIKKRQAVRAVLFDPAGRLLMFKYRHDPHIFNPKEPPVGDYWGTVGGGVEADENLEQALLREIAEETGLADVRIGPLVFRRNVDLIFYGDMVHVDETYFVAHTDGGDIVTERHTEIEKKFVADIRWWSVPELEATEETIFPPQLVTHVAQFLAAEYPPLPLQFYR